MISQGPATERPAALRPALGQRLSCRRSIRGSSSARSAIRCCTCRIPRGSIGAAPRRCSTTSAQLNQLKLDEVGDPEIATRIAQYEMAYPHADVGPRADRPLEGTRAHLRHVRPRRRRSPARSPPIACWPGGWPSAACGSCSSSTAAGTSTRTCRRSIRRPVPRHRSAVGGPDPGSEAARPARRHARRLGRRVRPDGLLPGETDADNYGRDHHPRCFTVWLAGGGIKPGISLRRDRRLRRSSQERSPTWHPSKRVA